MKHWANKAGFLARIRCVLFASLVLPLLSLPIIITCRAASVVSALRFGLGTTSL